MFKDLCFITLLVLTASCKSIQNQTKTASDKEPTFAYKQQMENLEKEIYFRATGNEPAWSLKISKNQIEFTSMKPGFETYIASHLNPVKAMDANIKTYRISNEFGTMNIQIQQQNCTDTMSGAIIPYTVKIEMSLGKKDNITNFIGCGHYITDYKLNDIWVLESINGKKAEISNYNKELPNLEINCSNNQFLGFAGCNRMSGSVFFEYGLLKFNNIATTRMACEPNNKESEFLKTLQSTTTYKIENLKLTLINQSGAELVFKKVD